MHDFKMLIGNMSIRKKYSILNFLILFCNLNKIIKRYIKKKKKY